MNSRYALDRDHAKLMGVCAGFARWADVDPTLARATIVLMTLFLSPVVLVAYLLIALVANDG